MSLGIRRWFGSGTLSPSTPTPDLSALGVTVLSLFLLFLLVGIRQGFGRALGQLFDFPGHLRLVKAAADRLRKSSRIVAVAIGATVLVWTSDQMLTYSQPRGSDDLRLLTKSRGLGELTFEHGVYATVIPWRDVFSMGDYLPLAILAAVIIFQAATKAGANPYILARSEKPTLSIWATFAWGSSALYVVHRVALLIAGANDPPKSWCAVPFDSLVVPLLMMQADGLIVAWILVELRNASLGDTGNELIDADSVVQLFPVAIFACVLALPARYLSMGALLLLETFQYYLPSGWITNLLGWQIREGIMYEQGLAFLTVGVVGAAAWTRGNPRAALAGYGRILAAEGGRLVAILGAASVVAGVGSGIAYSILLSLPTQTWVLAAADSYAHYVTMPVGLMILAALVELGERTLPNANLSEAGNVQDAAGV